MSGIGTPLSEALSGTNITLATSKGPSMVSDVLKVSGFEVSQAANVPAPSVDKSPASLVMTARPQTKDFG